MNSNFIAGFGNELVKEARLRAVVGKMMARGKDYMRRRRLAKQLGVKPADVDRVLAIRAKRARRRKFIGAGLTSAGVAAGGLAGAELTD